MHLRDLNRFSHVYHMQLLPSNIYKLAWKNVQQIRWQSQKQKRATHKNENRIYPIVNSVSFPGRETVKDLRGVQLHCSLPYQTISAGGVPSSGRFVITHVFSSGQIWGGGKAREHFVPHTACKYTSWPDTGTGGDKSVRRIKHFPPFSNWTLPFLPNQTQAWQGMPCDGVFLNNCSTFPSFAAHTPPWSIVYSPPTDTKSHC